MMLINRRHMILLTVAALGSVKLGDGAAIGLDRDEDGAVTVAINQIRYAHGVQPLVMHKPLQQVALYQAQLMAKHGKLKHRVGIGKGFRSRLHKEGIRTMAAENIAAGQPDVARVLAAWMRSKGHRRNMLDPAFAYYGLASAVHDKRPDYPYWTLVLSV